jgi:Holliday junction resolvase
MNSKQKGARGERELVNKLKELGFKTERTVQYCGNTGEAADLKGLDKIHIECKRVERLNISDAISQAIHDAKEGMLPTVFHRKNNENWLVTMEIEDWIKLYREFIGG